MDIAIVDNYETFSNYKMDNWVNKRDGNIKFVSLEGNSSILESTLWDIIFVSLSIMKLPKKKRDDFLMVIHNLGKSVSFYNSAPRDHNFFDDIKELSIELQKEEDNQ